MGREYTIGEVAELLRISRDALRFYEKKGLIVPIKKKNGYRYYSDEHISSLLDILFLRKIQCSLQDIQTMFQGGTAEYLHDFFELRIKEEKERIRMHQQLLCQLMVSRKNSEKMIKKTNQYSIRPVPRTYIFSEIMKSMDQLREAWFQLVKKIPGLEHSYLHQQLIPTENHAYEEQYYLVLEEFAVKKLGLEETAKLLPSFQFDCCVYTTYESKTTLPNEQAVYNMQKWADEQGLALTGEIHSHYLWNYFINGKLEKSCVELYMPVKQQVRMASQTL